MEVHADPSSAERDPFHLQTEPLFTTLPARERDPAANGHDPMPREPVGPLQRPHGQAGRSRESGDLGHPAVRDHLPSGHPGDHLKQPTKRGRSGPSPGRRHRAVHTIGLSYPGTSGPPP